MCVFDCQGWDQDRGQRIYELGVPNQRAAGVFVREERAIPGS